VLRAVEWRVDESGESIDVLDWRGLRFATYSEATRQLVYRQPSALCVNARPQQQLIEFGEAPWHNKVGADDHNDVSVVATRQHSMYAASGDEATHRKRTAEQLLSARTALRLLAAPDHGSAHDDDAPPLACLAALDIDEQQLRDAQPLPKLDAFIQLYAFW
jgi:hypothetical protein